MEIVFPELVRASNRYRRLRPDDITRSTEVSPHHIPGHSPVASGLPRVSLLPMPNLANISLLGRNRMQLLRSRRRAELSREPRLQVNFAGIRLRASAIHPGAFSPTRTKLALELPSVSLRPA